MRQLNFPPRIPQDNCKPFSGPPARECEIMISGWFYFRLLCLPFWIINIFTNPVMGYPEHISQFDVFHTLNGLYLVVIQILQFYWFGLFMRMLYSYAKTGVAEDTQEKVEKSVKAE